MPAMVRPRGKARRIAFDILGVPLNMIKNKKRTRAEKYSAQLRNDTIKRQR